MNYLIVLIVLQFAFIYAWIDVAIVGTDYEMLKYRAKVVSGSATHMYAFQSNIAFSGRSKNIMPQSVIDELSRIINFTVVTVNFTAEVANSKDNWDRPWAQRLFMKNWLLQNTLTKNEVAHIGDCDEIIDPEKAWLPEGMECQTMLMHFSYYSPFCNFDKWRGSGLIKINSTLFANAKGNEMHPFNFEYCPVSTDFRGWHISYAFSTEKIKEKTTIMGHSGEPRIQRIYDRSNDIIDNTVKECNDIIDNRGEIRGMPRIRSSYNSIPPVAGWPHHPFAPNRPVVSNKRGICVLIHVPHTAGNIMSKSLGAASVVINHHSHSHDTTQNRISNHLLSEYDGCPFVATVRNPYDRIYAMYHSTQKNVTFEQFVLTYEETLLDHPAHMPCFHFLSIHGNLEVTDIIKFESFEADFSDFCKRYGYPCSEKIESHIMDPVLSQHDKAKLYNPLMQVMVEKLFRSDFRAFAYSYESWLGQT